MKKTFPLRPEGKNPERVLDAIKHEIRKYLQRERNKPLPEGTHYWAFDCRFGADAVSAQSIHASAIRDCVSAAAAEGRESFYLEILARPAVREAQAHAGQDGQTDDAADLEDGE
ncbi:MAG: DUF6172 family protein [Comamonas sp.]